MQDDGVETGQLLNRPCRFVLEPAVVTMNEEYSLADLRLVCGTHGSSRALVLVEDIKAVSY